MTDENPSTPDSVSDYAADLRALRLRADSPTLSRLQHDTGVSKSVLSSAFSGHQLPSARTVDRLVRALGADPAEWIHRRDALLSASTSTGTAAAVADGLESGTAALSVEETGHTPVSRSLLKPVLALALAFLLGVGAAGIVSWNLTSAAIAQARDEGAASARKELTAAPVSSHAQINVSNGVDPALSPCVNDAKVATASNRTNNTKLEIIWSNKCYAGWARITRYDEKVSGNSMTVSIYPETAPMGPDRQTATEPNVQSGYTTLVVRPTPETRLCAVGSITLDGESIDLGEPLCI